MFVFQTVANACQSREQSIERFIYTLLDFVAAHYHTILHALIILCLPHTSGQAHARTSNYTLAFTLDISDITNTSSFYFLFNAM